MSDIGPVELAVELARCDRELEEMEREGASGLHPAYLITLAMEDWLAEKRILVGGLCNRIDSKFLRSLL